MTIAVGPADVERLVLDDNGRRRLEECLPSVREAAARSPVPCSVAVVDNDSTDGSCELVARRWPDVRLIREENRGLASFNGVLARLDAPVVVLLNNDIKLAPDAIGPAPPAVPGARRHPVHAPTAGRSTAALMRG